MKDVDRKVVGDLLADSETVATTLLVIVLRAYKDEVFGDEEQGIPPMDPVELWLRLEEDFHAVPHEDNENKLNALMLALSTDAFYEDIRVFNSICMALEDGDLGDLVEGTMDELTVPEMLWSIYEVELNRDDKVEFSPSIVAFMDKVMSREADDIEEEGEQPMAYWERFLADKREQLMQELRMIGVDEVMIRKLRSEELTPTHDDQGNFVPGNT